MCFRKSSSQMERNPIDWLSTELCAEGFRSVPDQCDVLPDIHPHTRTTPSSAVSPAGAVRLVAFGMKGRGKTFISHEMLPSDSLICSAAIARNEPLAPRMRCTNVSEVDDSPTVPASCPNAFVQNGLCQMTADAYEFCFLLG